MMIDGRSLLAVAAALCLMLGLVVLALERRGSQPLPGLRLWAISNFILGTAAALHMLQGIAPPWVPAFVGNALLLVGRASSVASLRQFDHLPVPRRALAGACAAAILGIGVALFAWPSVHLRGGLVVGSMALLSGWAVGSLLTGRPWRISRVVTATGLLGMMVTNLARLWVHVTATDAPSALDPNAPVVAFYIGVLLVFDVLANVGFVLLVTDRMHDRVLQLARTDYLTGALSRGALVSQAQRDLQRARRQRGVTAAFIVDIDEFKLINDRWGHAAGDAALCHVARHGQTVLRCTDLFARWGGDEFVALLPETDLLTAAAIAERLRVAVAEPDPAAGPVPSLPPVTVSIGVAAIGGGAQGLDELIAQADQALYNAKNAGRNRTRVADDAEAPGNTSLQLLQGRR